MSCRRLIQCCGDDAEPTPTPRPAAAIPEGRTSVAVPADTVSLATLRPANTSRTPTATQASQQTQHSGATTEQQNAFQELWLKAMAQIKASDDGPELGELIQTATNSHPADGDITATVLFKTLQDEMNRVGLKGKLADMMEDIVPYLNRVMIVGDVAISANPNPAAFPWAAVRFLLLDIRVKIIEGMAEMTILVYQSTKAVADAWRIEDFTEYLQDLITAKDRLHDAGYMCELYRGTRSHGILKDMYEVVKKEAVSSAEDRAKAQLKDLLVDPKDAVDHIHHTSNSFCLDGTRVAVLQDIKSWAEDPKSPTVCWLPGLAGTGKSTIARTIARDLKGSSFGGAFFFKKGAGNRGNGHFLFSVSAYQLAMNIPPLLQTIVDAIKQDDSSAVAPKDIQWRKLVQEPLVALQTTGFDKPILLVIDALDECEEDDRGEILTLLASCTTIKVSITSRPELDIGGHFAKTMFHREIVLYRVDPGTIEQDINTFIRHALSHFVLEYNRSHPQEYMQLQPNWPGDDKTKLIVSRSLPLFIAAATFIRMIKNRYWTKSPNDKINFIVETFAKIHSQYDALYRPVLGLILSHSPGEDHAEIIAKFAAIIGSFILLADSLSITSLAKLLNIEPHVIISQVDPLRSVIDVPSDDSPIRLFHLSFRDYLVSKSAGDLQVSEPKATRRLRSIVLNS
ncbi:uncharacterized protein FIESC28_10933 [Fusarium coffeatum]|uniref:NACHT domain-containing protein n=1 Tax=Fusarium coffeatum TaxID=231269 RepID=A0A366QPP2_9HYPO|nr:uncharacterized protein FIESC28_10933 [Fusarium coffeatum]RBR06817.1 hypothetical protein FIESC28_10933 [Fusarium coffeatum]